MIEQHYTGSDESGDNQLMRYKVRELLNELNFITRELNALDQTLYKEQQKASVFHKMEAVVDRKTADFQKNADKKEAVDYQEIETVVMDNASEIKRKPYARRNFESAIGRNFMGILASVLIFFSLVFFATLYYSYLDDVIKMAVMYGISFIFLITGLVKGRKDRDNKLYQSITGCGLGAVYISLFISNIYFEMLNDIALYLLIALWAVFICFLSRFHSVIFQVIGQIGILISVAFGTALCINADDTKKFIFLTIFFVITSTLFLVVHYKKEYEANRINLIFNTISAMLLSNGIFSIGIEDKGNIYRLIALAVLLVYILGSILSGYLFFKTEKPHQILFAVVNIFYTFAGIILLIEFLDELCIGELLSIIPVMVFVVALFIANDFKLKNRADKGRLALNVMLLFVLFIECFTAEQVSETVSLVLFIIPLMAWGYLKEDFTYKIFALIYSGLFLFNFDMDAKLHLVLGIMVVAFSNGFMLWKREQYHGGIKNASYIFLHLYILKGIVDIAAGKGELLSLCLLLCHSIINIAAMKTAFSKNWLRNEKDDGTKFITYFINAICMFLALSCIATMDNEVYHIIAILMGALLFLVNTANLLSGPYGMAMGFYIGIKLTVFIVTVTCSFDASDFIISIVLLIASIASIVTGFVSRIKAFRLYGLILVLISTVKLVMVDIGYSNTLERAASFFICGILCFVISFLYNYLDKKLL